LLPEPEAPGLFRADLLQATVPFSFELLPTELNIYKLAHLLLFTLIGYLLISRRPYETPIGIQVGIIGLFALATESMQVLATSRAGSLSDVLIDLSGVCCGLLAAAAVRHRYDQ
jgi:VanZ family protein